MILEEERTDRGLLIGDTAGGGAIQLNVVLYAYIVLEDGDTSSFLYRAVVVEARSAEVDVVGLPLESRTAGVCTGSVHRIDSAAVAEVGVLDTVAVEHLKLVRALDVYAAVALALTALVRHIGFAPLNVDVSVAVGLLGDDIAVTHGHDVALVYPVDRRAVAVRPVVERACTAVEKNDLCHIGCPFTNKKICYVYYKPLHEKNQ